MQRLTIFTDPHLGTARQSHTTAKSAAALRETLYQQAMSIVSLDDTPKLCAGDLFDRAFNSEATLVQGFNVASRCWRTLSGNHDMANREGVVTTLDALAEMGVPICRTPDLTNPYFEAFESIYMVPHHASQAVFLQACSNAAAHATARREGLASYLFLHCNYDFGLATEDNTLNLPAAEADVLLDSFDFIFIGHEHKGGRHGRDGRVVVLGNTHPTSFADISDKFVYDLELDTAELTPRMVWSMEQSYLQLQLGDPIPDLENVRFVDVLGQEGVVDAMAVNAYIREIWAAGPELFAVRNKVLLKDSLADIDTDVESVQVESLIDRIVKDLKDSDLLPIFNELAAEEAV